MKRRLLAALVLAAAAAACQMLAGLDDRPFVTQTEDAGASDAPSEHPPADPCAHAGLPTRPDATPDLSAPPTYVMALRELDFSAVDDAGGALGLDLDGVCTCDSRPGSAHGGASSCGPPPPESDVCDKDGGVDNALFDITQKDYPAYFSNGAVSGTVNQPIDCGEHTILIQLTEYNGRADDDAVSVGFLTSFGIRDAHDGGERLDAGCASQGPPYPAKWDGTDVWSFSSVTGKRVTGNSVFPAVIVHDAFVTGFRLVVPTPVGQNMFFGTTPLYIAASFLVAKLTGVDAAGHDVDGGVDEGAVQFRIGDGQIGGRASTTTLLAALGELRPGGSTPVCTSVFAHSVQGNICAAADIAADPNHDFQTDPATGRPFPCDALSVALKFRAAPAQLGNVYDVDAGVDAGCPAAWYSCSDQ